LHKCFFVQPKSDGGIKEESLKADEEAQIVKQNFAKSSTLGFASLKLENLQKPSFHDEFMANIDEYSKSWRDAALKEKRF
jgi:hypothetical protein